MKTIKTLMAFFLSVIIISGIFNGCQRKGEEITKIGVILPLTGPAAQIGEQHKAGLEIALKKYSNNPGNTIQLIYEDDSADPKKAVSAANKLISADKANILISVMSGSSMAILPIADAKKIVFFANCGHPTINQQSKYVYRNFPSSRQEIDEMIPYLTNIKKYKNIGLLYINDAFGMAAKDLAENSITKTGSKLVFAYSYETKASDFRNVITKISSEKIDGLYIYGYGDATANLLNQLRELKYDKPIIGNYNFSGPPISVIAKKSLNGTIFTAPDFTVYSNDEKAKDFIKTFRDEYSKDPFWNAAIEYDAMSIIGEALKTNISNDSLQLKLSQIRNYEGIAGKYQLRDNEWIAPLSIKTYENDSLIIIYKP